MITLQNELSIESRNALTEPLFGIKWVEGKHPDGSKWAIPLDEDGDQVSTLEADLKTLGGIIKYACEIAREDERKKIRTGLKSLLGL